MPYIPGPPQTAPPPTYQPPYPAPSSQPKKKRTGRTLGLVALLLLVLCGSGIAAVVIATGGGTKSATHTVVLEVSGPATADITYGIGADQSQETDATVPWRKELTSDNAVLITVLLAQSKGTGPINCKITVDGAVVKQNTSTGEFAIVTCSNG